MDTLIRSQIKAVRAELAAWLAMRTVGAVWINGRDVLRDLDALLIEDNLAMRRILAEDVGRLGRVAGR